MYVGGRLHANGQGSTWAGLPFLLFLLLLSLTTNRAISATLFAEDFEGPGYENTGWTPLGEPPPDPDYSVSPLQGAHSLRCVDSQLIRRSFDYSDKFYMYFKVRWDIYDPGNNVIDWEDVATTTTASIYADFDKLMIFHGSGTAMGSTTIQEGVLYHAWLEWTKGTGANGTMKLYLSTDGIKPAAPEASVANGTGNAVDRIFIGPFSPGADVLFDQILVSDAPIGNAPDANAAPTISDIPNQTILTGATLGPLGFTVGDLETPAASLTLSGSSSNPTLVPNANITFGGSGASRTLTLTPAAGQSGTSTITVTVSDGSRTRSDTFLLTVGNTAPTISDIGNQTTSQNTPLGPLAFTVGDAQTAAGSLTVTASSSNTGLVPNSGVALGGSGANRTITLTPAAGQSGSATITITVSDGALSANDTFVLTVLSASPGNGSWVLNEGFEGPGYENPGWIEIGTPLPDYTAVVLKDHHSLLLTNGSILRRDFAFANSFYFYARVRWARFVDGATLFYFEDNSFNASGSLSTSGGALQIIHGGASDSGSTLIAPNTTYHLWLEWTKGSGANGTMNLYLSTTGTKPGSPEASLSTGSGQAVARLYIGTSTTISSTILDTLLVSDQSIGSNPDGNRAPAISDVADQTISEDGSTSALSFSVSDLETAADSLIMSASSSNPSLVPTAAIQFGGSGASRTVTVTPAADQFGSATITLTVSDGSLSASSSFVLTVNPVNDAPSLAFPAGTRSYTENDGPVLLDSGATFADLDSPNLASGHLTLHFAANGAAEDRLAIRDQGTGAGQIGLDGDSVTYEGVVIGTFSGGSSGSSPLVIAFNGSSSPAAAQALLRHVTYENVSETPSTLSRTIQAVATDGDGGTSPAATLIVSVTAVADDPVITWANPAAIVYGTALSSAQLNATADVPGTFTYTPTAGTVLNAGNGQVLSTTFTPTDTVNYNSRTVTVSINVAKAPLTISAADKSKLYGAGLPVLTATYDGFVNGDTASSLDTPLSLNTSATAASGVGSYPITATGASDANYNVTHHDGVLTVTRAALTIMVEGKAKVYGAALPALTATYDGFVNGDTSASLDTPLSLTTAATAASPVGTYAITGANAEDANYTITYQQASLTVTPAALSITADNKSKAYGAALPTFTATYDGFVNGDTAANLDTPVSLTTTAADASPAGEYAITAAGASDANYIITHHDGTLTVTRAALLITVEGKSKVYGAALPPLTATYDGFVNGDTPASLDTPLSLTTTATSASPVGTYAITGADAADANYTITYQQGSLTVTPAALSITADNKNKVYGAALPALTATYDGFVNGDTPSSLDAGVTLTSSATAASPAGEYAITAAGASDANYIITHHDGTLTVTRAALHITVEDKTKVYGAALPALTATYDGFVNGDTPASLDTPLSLTTAATAASPVGTYPIVGAEAAGANYSIAYQQGSLTVTPAALSITADNKNKVYGAALPEFTATYDGFVNGDTPASLDTAVTLTSSATAASPVGEYAITAAGAADANYIITHHDGTLTVARAALSITADLQTKVYGAAVPTLTATYEGFVNGDTPANLDTGVSLTTTATAASPVGSYPITAEGAADANYTIMHHGSSLSVTPAALSITAVDKSRAYLQPNPSLTASYSGFVLGDTAASLDSPVTLSTTATLASPAGQYTITASGAADANYVITHANGTLTINAGVPPVVTLPALSLAYSENGGKVVLDGTATVTDLDTPDFDGGTLTVDFSTGGTAEDRLAVLHQGTAAGEIGVSGQEIQYGGVTIGTFSGGTDGSTPLVIALNAQATPETVQSLLRRVAYENVSELPDLTVRLLRVVLDDGHGGVSLPATLTISIQATPDNPGLAWAAPVPLVYGTALDAARLNATASVPGTFTYLPPAGTVLHAGNGQTLSVTFTPDDLVNYSTASLTVSLDVTPAPLTIEAEAKSMGYGTSLPVLTARYTGLVNNETPADLATPVVLETTATASSPVGAYVITAHGAADPDYTITFVDGSLAVTPAVLTITADNQPKAYGAALPTLNASFSGFVNGDTPASLTSAPTLGTTATASSPAGSYPITVGGAAALNYTIHFVDGTLTVTPVALSIRAEDKSKLYGEGLPTFTATYAGFVNGDTAANLAAAPTLTTTATAGSPAGSYVIEVSGAASPNYNITFVSGTLTVAPAPLHITANDTSKTYGAELPALNATYTGLVNGDTPTTLATPATLATTATAASPVGHYVITVSGAADPNYVITLAGGDLSVVAAALLITADNETKIYGEPVPALTATYAGFVNGDDATSLDTPVVLDTAATAGSPVGSYTITAAGASDANYVITFASGTLTITPAALTITADNKAKVYGDALPTLTASYAGFVNGDGAASLASPVVLNTSATAATPVGVYSIVASGAASPNYTIQFVDGTLTISRASATITAEAKSKAYGAPLPTLTASHTGLVNGDTPSSLATPLQLTTTATAQSPAGSYPITATAADPNYDLVLVNSLLTVTPATLTITANDKLRAFQQPNPTLTATYSGLVNGDTPASLSTPVVLTTTAELSSPAGTYPITASGATAANYMVVHVNGTLTVLDANAPVVTWPAGELTYTENAAPVLLDPNATVLDADTPHLGGGNITVDFKLNGTPDDRLAIQHQGNNTGEVGVNGTDVAYGGVTVGTWTGGQDGSSPLVISLNDAATPEIAQAVLRQVTYANASEIPSTLARTIRAVVDDGHAGVSAPATLTVNVAAVPDNPTMTWANPAAIGYGTALSVAQLNATASVPGTFAYTPAAGSILHAGNGQILSVQFTPDDSVNYSTVTATVQLDVLRAPLVISAVDQTKAYGADVPTLTANYAGFVNGDTPASLDVPVALSTAALAASPVGLYAITVGGASDADYEITFTPGTLTITRASLVISAENQSKVYGAALPVLTASYVGFINGDTPASLDTPVTLSTDATAASNVGSYPITAGGAADANYTISYASGTLTVTRAALTITAENKSKVYGGALPTLSATYTGLVNGDTSASLDTPAALTTTATATSPVGLYVISAAGAADANYTISFVDGALNVTAAALVITADSQSKVYGAALPELTASYNGLVNGDTAADIDTPPALTTAATAASAVGTYTISAANAADANYTISYVDGSLNVTPAALTITAEDKSKVYGETLPALTAHYAGFVNGDTATALDTPAALTTTATAASPAGTYAITVGGAVDANYTISFVPGTLTVTRSVLTITADDKGKVYGTPNPAFTATYSGFLNSDTPASLDTPATFSSAPSSSGVGTYPIVVSGATSANYTIVFAPGTLTVTPAPLVVSAHNMTKLYGEAVLPLTATYSGFVNGDTAASLDVPVTLASTVAAGSPVGSYAITASGAADANYSITHMNGTFTVLPAALTVRADDKSMLYGGAVPELTISYLGLVNGDTPASLLTPATVASPATPSSSVGTYLIIVSGATAANYTVTHVNGVLTVGRAHLVITADDRTNPYGEPLPVLTASYGGFVNGDTPASLDAPVTLTTTATSASHAGLYPITAAGASDANYEISFVPGTLTVTPVLLTLTADSKSKVYGAPSPAFTFSAAGFKNGDTMANLDTAPTATLPPDSSHVGTYPITPAGAADVDYIISYAAGTLTITPAPLTITAENKTKVYLAAMPALTATYSGFVNGDTSANLDTPVNLATTADQNSPVGSYAITATGAADADYTITLVNGTLTVTEVPPHLSILGIGANGDVTLQITCQPGATLEVEESTDLVTWTQQIRLSVPSGATNYVDVGGASGPRKFYRLKLVP